MSRLDSWHCQHSQPTIRWLATVDQRCRCLNAGVWDTCDTPEVLVQIYGITTPEDAEMVNASAPDNVGVVVDEGFQT